MNSLNPEPILSLENIFFSFPGGIHVLKGLTLSLYPGELVALAGRNGCGKTVLMKHLNSLLVPDSGKVLFMGSDAAGNKTLLRQKVGLVFQNSDNQLLRPTVEQDVSFGPGNLGWSREKTGKAVDKAIETMGLQNYRNRRPHTLSGGWKKRAAIAGVLAMDPELICLDEPFTGLDFEGVCQVTQTLIKLKSLGKSMLIITHDLEKVLSYSDRLVLMGDGIIARSGNVEEVLPHAEDLGVKRPWGDMRKKESMSWLA